MSKNNIIHYSEIFIFLMNVLDLISNVNKNLMKQ